MGLSTSRLSNIYWCEPLYLQEKHVLLAYSWCSFRDLRFHSMRSVSRKLITMTTIHSNTAEESHLASKSMSNVSTKLLHLTLFLCKTTNNLTELKKIQSCPTCKFSVSKWHFPTCMEATNTIDI